MESRNLKAASLDDFNLAISSALQAILQKIGLVTPYDLQHILDQMKIDLDGKEKRFCTLMFSLIKPLNYYESH